MLQLIFHGIGDYFFQTDKQALNKKKAGREGLWYCLKHCITYSLLFFFIGDWKAVLIIFTTHFIIDRTQIVAYLIAIKNNCKKTITHKVSISSARSEEYGTVEEKVYDISNFGFPPSRPQHLTFWLYIICDNLCHIICNYLALKYL